MRALPDPASGDSSRPGRACGPPDAARSFADDHHGLITREAGNRHAAWPQPTWYRAMADGRFELIRPGVRPRCPDPRGRRSRPSPPPSCAVTGLAGVAPFGGLPVGHSAAGRRPGRAHRAAAHPQPELAGRDRAPAARPQGPAAGAAGQHPAPPTCCGSSAISAPSTRRRCRPRSGTSSPLGWRRRSRCAGRSTATPDGAGTARRRSGTRWRSGSSTASPSTACSSRRCGSSSSSIGSRPTSSTPASPASRSTSGSSARRSSSSATGGSSTPVPASSSRSTPHATPTSRSTATSRCASPTTRSSGDPPSRRNGSVAVLPALGPRPRSGRGGSRKWDAPRPEGDLRRSAPRCPRARRVYFGGMRMPPSTRIVSALR